MNKVFSCNRELQCLSKRMRAKKLQIKLKGGVRFKTKRKVFTQVMELQELLVVEYHEHQKLRLVQGAPDKFRELESNKSY